MRDSDSGLRLQARVFVPTIFIAALILMTVATVITVIESYGTDQFDVSSDPISVATQPVSKMPQKQGSTKFHDELLRHGVGVVVDPQESNMPGLAVFDPAGEIPWLTEFDGQFVAGDKPKVVLFAGTYCSDLWESGQECALLPPGSSVIGTIDPPRGTRALQYAWSPAQSDTIPHGMFTFTSDSEALAAALAPLFAEAELATTTVFRPPLREYVENNPMIRLLSTLTAWGMIAAWLYWFMAHRRGAAHYAVHHAIGATRWRILLAATALAAKRQLLATVVATPLVAFFIALMSNTDIPHHIWVVLLHGATAALLATWVLHTVALAAVLFTGSRGTKYVR